MYFSLALVFASRVSALVGDYFTGKNDKKLSGIRTEVAGLNEGALMKIAALSNHPGCDQSVKDAAATMCHRINMIAQLSGANQESVHFPQISH